jgi:transglutaminase-like putative cysteine protease
MRKYVTYHYKTKVTFSNVISGHAFLLRCTPHCNEFQQLADETLRVYPLESISKGDDSFGNIVYSGRIDDLHDLFEFETWGEVYLTESYTLAEPLNRIYLYPSVYTHPDENIVSLLRSVPLDADDKVTDKVVKLSDALFRVVEYVPNSTNIYTTASDVLKQGKGVCQDFSHVMIALCRLAGIAARYVAGFTEGEGYTHAWVEYYDAGYWRAIDPTYNTLVETGYVKLSHGRDYEDCSIERGVFSGIVTQALDVQLTVEMCEVP